MRLVELKSGATVADPCVVAASFSSRLVGLMGKTRLEPGEALLFPRCRSVHMWFMRISIDVVFLRGLSEGQWEVTSLHAGLRPWRLLPVTDLRADDALEMAAGEAERRGIIPGAVLCTG